jgi:hypothetical protein
VVNVPRSYSHPPLIGNRASANCKRTGFANCCLARTMRCPLNVPAWPEPPPTRSPAPHPAARSTKLSLLLNLPVRRRKSPPNFRSAPLAAPRRRAVDVTPRRVWWLRNSRCRLRNRRLEVRALWGVFNSLLVNRLTYYLFCSHISASHATPTR